MKGPNKTPLKEWTVAALALTVSLAFSAQDVTEARLQQACASLQRAPFAAADLQTLLDASRHATNSPALRSRAMAAYSLTLLMQGNTNAFGHALQILRATYPQTAPLITVSREDGYATCDACAGSGVQMALCPACMGSGKCKPCAGTGKKDSAACPACKGRGDCAMCAGKQKIETACPTCKGTRQVFKPSAKIRDNYNTLLTNIVSICQENARYSEQFHLASLEADNAKRIVLFQNLLQEFPHRTDLGPALKLMRQAVNVHETQEALQRKQLAREQSERELEALRKLRDSDDLNGAIATLATYLKGHPNTPALGELQALLDELTAARDRKLLTKKILYGVLSLFGVLFILTCLRPFLFKKKPDHFGPLPGMDKLDKSKYTDPLSLTSQESKARVKTKTVEITPSEE